MNNSKEIFVYFHPRNFTKPQFLGTLISQFIRGKELFSFEFDRDFLSANPTQYFDPELQFFTGAQYTGKVNFGMFMDSSPDRWGRKLMLRREAIRARQEGRMVQVLNESDFLLGVEDETRMGAIRFTLKKGGEFLNNDKSLSTPPWTRLRELEEASRNLEKESNDQSEGKWIDLLVCPGSSLGGARPKANVLFPDGSIWIAKFPSRNDVCNIAAWEYMTMQMAKDVGLNVPECKLEHFSKYGSTFLSKRFDREGKSRIHYASAMTLLGARDGDDAMGGSSYLDIAEFIIRHGANPDEDLKELWKRIVFSIAVSNTDDHLRNHGFLLTSSGWRLSPAFDINPNAQGYGLSLNISDIDNSLDFSLAIEVASLFRVNIGDANIYVKKVLSVVAKWRTYANYVHLSRSQQDEMATAFRVKFSSLLI